jgi:hypothetical protein
VVLGSTGSILWIGLSVHFVVGFVRIRVSFDLLFCTCAVEGG